MRERRPADWVHDLNGRHRLERQVAAAMDDHQALTLTRICTERFDRPDYTVATRRVPVAAVELKAKRQPYRGWTRHRPNVTERDLFIVDELALRRLIEHGHHGHLLIYDLPATRWVIFGVVDLLLAPKARVARPLNGSHPTTKGKVLLDLGDGHHAGHELDSAISILASLIDDTDRRWAQVEPWPAPHKEAS